MHTKVAKIILSLVSVVIFSPIRPVAASESEGALIIIHRGSHGEMILSSPSRCRTLLWNALAPERLPLCSRSRF
jgi:hypothetical protein